MHTPHTAFAPVHTPSSPQRSPAFLALCCGPSLSHTSSVHGLPSSAGTSESRPQFTAAPLPSQARCRQSPLTCASSGSEPLGEGTSTHCPSWHIAKRHRLFGSGHCSLSSHGPPAPCLSAGVEWMRTLQPAAS